jgi:dolichyl-phosphate beta-glucosyltransferase
MEEVFLSVVIPAYNEEKRLPNSLNNILNHLNNKDYKYEIIIVDDGSKDSTIDVIQKFGKKYSQIYLLKNLKNMGKGFSVKKGILQSSGKYVLFTDADLSTPIEEVDKFIETLERGFDIATASRFLPNSNLAIPQPWHRKLMGFLFRYLVSFIALKGFTDTQCGFKCFREKVAKDIFSRQRLTGFGFDVEILFIAKKLKYNIIEIPVVWRDSPQTRLNPFIHPIKMLFDLFKIRIYNLKGAYK